MKKLFLLVPLLLVFVTGVAFFWWKNVLTAVNKKDSTKYSFTINKGQSVGQIATKLEKQGLIKDDLAFRLYTKLTHTDKLIKPGEYKLSPNLTLEKLVELLLSGPSLLWVTIPEGLRREELPARYIKGLEIKPENQQKFTKELLEKSKNLEGMLFPDTYKFSRDVTPATVISTMTNTFNQKVTSQMVQDAAKKGLNLTEVLSLAAIVERETKTSDERPLVAGILFNRIEIKMPLQVDATLQYIFASETCKFKQDDCDWWTPPTVEQKKIRSPYNTYVNTGIPPAPIASPGLTSIKAVIYSENSNYLYYLHGNDGKIRFAETLEEHNGNIQKYLR